MPLGCATPAVPALPCRRRLPCVLASVRLRVDSKLACRRLRDVNAVVPRRLLDVGKCELPIRFRDVNYLTKARYCVTHMPRIGERFLALLGKRIDAVRQVALRGQLAVLFVGFPGRFHTLVVPDSSAATRAGRKCKRARTLPRTYSGPNIL